MIRTALILTTLLLPCASRANPVFIEALKRLTMASSPREASKCELDMEGFCVMGGAIGTEPIRSMVIELLNSPDWWLRRAVLKFLQRGRWDDPEILGIVDRLYFNETSVEVHVAALKASCRKTSPRSTMIARVREAISALDPRIHDSAMEILLTWRYQADREALEMILLDQELVPSVRRQVIAYLLEIGTRNVASVFPLALRIAKEEDKEAFFAALKEQSIGVELEGLLAGIKAMVGKPDVPKWASRVAAAVKRRPRWIPGEGCESKLRRRSKAEKAPKT